MIISTYVLVFFYFSCYYLQYYLLICFSFGWLIWTDYIVIIIGLSLLSGIDKYCDIVLLSLILPAGSWTLRIAQGWVDPKVMRSKILQSTTLALLDSLCFLNVQCPVCSLVLSQCPKKMVRERVVWSRIENHSNSESRQDRKSVV